MFYAMYRPGGIKGGGVEKQLEREWSLFDWMRESNDCCRRTDRPTGHKVSAMQTSIELWGCGAVSGLGGEQPLISLESRGKGFRHRVVL